MRRTVAIGAAVLALLIEVDFATNLAAGTPGVMSLAPWELSAAGLSAVVGLAARRGRWPGEPLAFVLLLVASGVILIGLALAPTGRLLGSAQLATLLVGAGLILPWSQRWHIGAIVATLHELHHDVRPVGILAHVVQRDDVRMADRRGAARLTREPRGDSVLVIGVGAQPRQGHRPVELLVVGAVDGRHAAAADRLVESIPPPDARRGGVAGPRRRCVAHGQP